MSVSSSPTPSQSGGIAGALDAIAKAGAAIGVLALGTAFLYDFFYWLRIDFRVLSFFEVADHIETAIVAVGLIALLLVVMAVVYAMASDFIRRLASPSQARLHKDGAQLSCLGMVAMMAWNFLMPSNEYVNTVAVIAITLLAGFGAASSRSVPMRAVTLLTGWVCVTVSAALVVSDAHAKGKFTYSDIVTIETAVGPQFHYEIEGHVLRFVDRGVVIKGAQDGRVIFVPKEHIFRIDQRVPKAKQP